MDRSLIKILTGMLLTMTVSTFVYADEETGFDSIVKELKSSLKDPAPAPRAEVDNTRIIAGAALAGGYVAASEGSAMLSGFDLHVGIELFTPEWIAETSLRSFGSGRASQGVSLSMNEFDIKIVHRNEFQKSLSLRVGGGLSAQYLKTTQNGNSSTDQTPAFIALVGVEKQFTPKLSLGPDVSFRLPMVSGVSEKGSLDASLRLNFYF